jgi:hypothetical protein
MVIYPQITISPLSESLSPEISQPYPGTIPGSAYSLVELDYACTASDVFFYLIVITIWYSGASCYYDYHVYIFVFVLLYCRGRLVRF